MNLEVNNQKHYVFSFAYLVHPLLRPINFDVDMITNLFIKLKPYQQLKLSQPIYALREISKDVKKPNSRSDYRVKAFMQEKTYEGTVQSIFTASPTIKVLTIHLKENDFTFKAGQWVDFQVPGISEVSGYSITSPPCMARKKGTIDLAVKYGTFPLTHWIHRNCCGGEKIHVRVGGDFFYDPQPGTLESTADLLLLGGGVGINPMVSILHEYRYLYHLQPKKELGIRPVKVNLLYSAKTEEELVFKDTLSQIEMECPTVTCQYFISGDSKYSKNPRINYSRIKEVDVVQSLRNLKINNTLCYICGPSAMTDDINNWLLNFGVDKKFIKYEKWW